MITLKYDCPHCQAQNSAFTFVKSNLNRVLSSNIKYVFNIFFQCNNCGSCVIVENFSLDNAPPETYHGDILMMEKYHLINIFPEQKTLDKINNLPPQVEKSFVEGQKIIKESPTAACGLFRRCLDVGLKIISPEVDGNLINRIDKLAEKNKITPALQSWAHRIRLDGNNAMHEIEDASLDDARKMYELTKYILIYLFTLPKQIEDAQK